MRKAFCQILKFSSLCSYMNYMKKGIATPPPSTTKTIDINGV